MHGNENAPVILYANVLSNEFLNSTKQKQSQCSGFSVSKIRFFLEKVFSIKVVDNLLQTCIPEIR
jgi:hypothetical protein